jgi:hypothetical protein
LRKSAGLFCPALTIDCRAGEPPTAQSPATTADRPTDDDGAASTDDDGGASTDHNGGAPTDDDGGAPTDHDGAAPTAARYDDHLSLLDQIVDLPWADLGRRKRHSFGILG